MNKNSPHTPPPGQPGCLTVLRSILPHLTKTERKAAEYILENPAEVIHLTITSLAETCSIAEATIFRLCKKAGFTGFQSFKIALAAEMYPTFATEYKEVSATDSPGSLAAKVFHSISEGLQDTLRIVDEKELAKAITAVCQAKRIYAYGSGVSSIVALDIEYRFIRFGIPVVSYSDAHMQYTSASLTKPGDVILVISHSGSNQDILGAIELAKPCGATVIAITSHLRSPISQAADITLCGMAREVNYRSEAMASRLMHMALVDALYVGVMLQQPDTIKANVQKMRTAVSRRKV